MCGPFVVAQVGQRLDRCADGDFTTWTRLRGAALAPYHLGRLTTYTGLGAIAGGMAEVASTRLAWFPAAMLSVAAVLFLVQAVGAWAPAWRTKGAFALPAGLTRAIAPLFADPTGWRGYALGVALGFLPCGLLYSALAAAAGGGSALAGAAGLAVFAGGTLPGLVAIGWGTALAGRRWRGLIRVAAGPLAAINGVLLATLAWRALA